MSISIAHPERYDEFKWTSGGHIYPPSTMSTDPDDWELVGFEQVDEDDEKPFLWGHLRPEYREPSELTELVADLRLRLGKSSEEATLNKGAAAIVSRRAARFESEAGKLKALRADISGYADMCDETAKLLADMLPGYEVPRHSLVDGCELVKSRLDTALGDVERLEGDLNEAVERGEG